MWLCQLLDGNERFWPIAWYAGWRNVWQLLYCRYLPEMSTNKGDKSITQSFRADGTQSKFVTRLWEQNRFIIQSTAGKKLVHYSPVYGGPQWEKLCFSSWVSVGLPLQAIIKTSGTAFLIQTSRLMTNKQHARPCTHSMRRAVTF